MSNKPEAMSAKAIMENVQGWFVLANEVAHRVGGTLDSDQAIVFEIAAQLRERDAAKKWSDAKQAVYFAGSNPGKELEAAMLAARNDGGISE